MAKSYIDPIRKNNNKISPINSIEKHDTLQINANKIMLKNITKLINYSEAAFSYSSICLKDTIIF